LFCNFTFMSIIYRNIKFFPWQSNKICLARHCRRFRLCCYVMTFVPLASEWLWVEMYWTTHSTTDIRI
jgi:hypothetical protein